MLVHLGRVQIQFPRQAVEDLATTKVHGAKGLYLDTELVMGVIWVQGKPIQVLCPIPFKSHDGDVALDCWTLCHTISESPVPSTALFDCI